MTAPMPRPEELITYDVFASRWPMGAEKCELWDGVVVWYGEFDVEDLAAAERAFPGRVAVLDETGCLELRPASSELASQRAGSGRK